MKYIFLLIITAWFVTAMCLSSCDKEPKPKPEPQSTGTKDTMYVDEEFKRYWYFPEGSWWVYKRTDTSADVYDTVTVYKSVREVVYYPNAFSYAGEMLKQMLSHSSKYFVINNKEHHQIVLNSMAYVNEIASGGGVFHYMLFFSWPIENSRNKYITDTLPITLPIGNVKNVKHFTYLKSGEIWMAKDIGFIKYKHNYTTEFKKGPSTWELVNYHINK